MKKMMVVAAAMCVALASNAAQFAWSTNPSPATNGTLYDGTSAAKAYATYGAVECYLFDAATYGQATAVTDLTKTGIDTSKAIESTTLNSKSQIATLNVTYGEATSQYDLYWVALFDDSTAYVSSLMEDKSPLGTGAQAIKWTDVADTSKAIKDASAGFSTAGVYNAVPEPTSGLLLLLGVAGLALRRRRA